MLLVCNDWRFDVDLEATMEYSANEAEAHCTCAYCRNFYASVDAVYPRLRPFLSQFGLDIAAPEELMPFDDGIYQAAYAVKGKLLQSGAASMESDGIRITAEQNDPEWFVLDTGFFQLPWVLDEPFEDVVSPANKPDFLKKMWNKLLGRLEDIPKS